MTRMLGGNDSSRVNNIMIIEKEVKWGSVGVC